MGQIIQFRAPAKDIWGFKHMGKMELMEELVSFHKDRRQVASLTPDLIERGLCLFGSLEKLAETPELRIVCRSYLNQLEASNFLNKNGLDN